MLPQDTNDKTTKMQHFCILQYNIFFILILGSQTTTACSKYSAQVGEDYKFIVAFIIIDNYLCMLFHVS